jgi:diguanylate cyclase (GGDEF)-like protein
MFPERLVEELVRALGVSGALVAERINGTLTYRSVACRVGGQAVAEFQFDPRETPAAPRGRSRTNVVAEVPAGRVPGVATPLHLVGVALYSASGQTIGLLGLLLDAVDDDANHVAVLSVFAARAEAELATARQLREHALVEAELRAQSRIDAQTGALNHGAIADALRDIVAGAGSDSCAVVMVDVDGLKAINDTYGDPVGDAVLTAVVAALSRDGAVVGRYGGDEFVAILGGAGVDRGDRFRQELLAALEGGVVDPASGTSVPIAVSVGLAVYPVECDRIDDLIKLAEGAMYASRRASGVESPETNPSRRLDGDRAGRLVGELVPLLTAPGSREDKLRLVAHQLSVGVGYDAVNFEVSGESAEPGATWEGAYVRAAQINVESWVHEQAQASDHPLGRLMDKTRRPIFIDRLDETELLTDVERELILQAGLHSALVVPMIWHDQLVGMLSVASKQISGFTAWDAQFLTAVSSQVTAIVFMTTLVEELQVATTNLAKAHSDTVMMLAAAAEAHDDTTGRHLQRVRLVTEALARELKYGEEQIHQLGLAAVLHDIGKVRVPDGILTSSASLSDDEWVTMRQHTFWGGDFLDGHHGFGLAAAVARCHHERWDGAGYPRGLRGDAIPEAAAITSVADSYDAMTNDRPYRAGRPASEAVIEIVRCSGEQFSPRVVDALVRLAARGALPMGDADDCAVEAA